MTRKSKKDDTGDGQDYEVGYRKPPKQHRFKRGVSGNPKGRKPRSVSIASTLRKLALEPRTVRIGERTQSLSTLEIAVRRQIEKVVQGDTKAFMALMGMLIEHVPELKVELERRVSSGEDLELLKDFVQRNTHLIARKT
jgi:hypothetical protein